MSRSCLPRKSFMRTSMRLACGFLFFSSCPNAVMVYCRQNLGDWLRIPCSCLIAHCFQRPELSNSFSEFLNLAFFGFEVIEEADDVAKSPEACLFMVSEVGDVSETGDAGLVEIDFAVCPFEGLDEVATEKFLDHLGMEV